MSTSTFLIRSTLIIAMTFLAVVLASATEVTLKNEGGVYTLPASINRAITFDFILDSGASEVNIPADVVSTLLRSRTISENDFLPGKSYTLTDGSKVRSQKFLIRELEVGNIRYTDVPAKVTPVRGPLLLGQSFLKKLDSWEIDNQRNVLVIRNRQKQASRPTETRTDRHHDKGAASMKGYCSIFPVAGYGRKIVNDRCRITKLSDNSYQLVWSDKRQMQITLKPAAIDGLDGQVTERTPTSATIKTERERVGFCWKC